MNDQPRAPLTTTTSIWPAAMVLIAGAVMLAVFLLINVIANQGIKPTPTAPPVIVGGLAKDPSNAALAYCQGAGTIPSNIADAFIVPVATRTTGQGRVPNAGAGDFDCYQPLATSASAGAVLGFYAAQLESKGWNLFSQGSSSGKPQDLFQKAGNDGFYWVVGVTITATSSGVSRWTYRIYQNSQTI